MTILPVIKEGGRNTLFHSFAYEQLKFKGLDCRDAEQILNFYV